MDQSFGNWVKRRRKGLDLTQQELAQRVGCSLATVVKIESDERRPSRQIAELLAQHLEIPVEQREPFLKVARKEKSPETLGGLAGVVQASPKLRTPIPSSPEPLFGREFELAEIERLMQDPRCRLLTLTGEGGIGKTRLALEAASQEHAYSYGGIFINLAPLSERDQIVTAIADALGVVLYTASDRSVQLISHLHEKELLLVLDNFEHLLARPECVSLPGDILKGAPQVKLLVTSREPLQLQSEWVFEVRGLPIPEVTETDAQETSSAVKLFAQRARQIRAGFAMTSEDRLAVREICELVDGMPLAIELAAAWTHTLTCAEIAREIQSNINFLSTSARDVAERHRSIRATFDYSWTLLSAEEQTVLRRLSVFKGGFTREAAEYVAGASLAVLSALVSKSLLHRTEPGRFDLHELVRQYSLDYLLRNEQEHIETQDRHSEYFSLLLQQRGEAFKGADPGRVAAELAAEIANLRQAWRWAGERGRAVQVGQAADTLFWLYESRCDCREGVPLFGHVARSLAAARNADAGVTRTSNNDVTDLSRARVMAYQGFFCLRQGQHPQSQELLQQSKALLRPLAESGSVAARDALAYTLAFLGIVTAALGNYADGRCFLHEGLEIKRAKQDRWGIAFCLRQLGLLAYYEGDYEEAHHLLNESLEVSRAIGNPWSIAYSLDFLSTAAYARGAYPEAEKLLQEGLRLSRSVGDRFTAAYGLNGLGLVKKALGDYPAARDQLEQSIAIWREIGDQASLAQSLNSLGDVLLEADEPPAARECFLEALAVARSAGLVPLMLDALLGHAILMVNEGANPVALQIVVSIKDHPAGTRSMKERAGRLHAELFYRLPAEELMNTSTDFHEAGFQRMVEDLLRSSAALQPPSLYK